MTVHNIEITRPATDGFGGFVLTIQAPHHNYEVRLSEDEGRELMQQAAMEFETAVSEEKNNGAKVEKPADVKAYSAEDTINPEASGTESYTEVREAFMAALSESETPTTTLGNVVEKSSYSRPTVNKRLQDLSDTGELESGEVNNTTHYWVAKNEVTSR